MMLHGMKFYLLVSAVAAFISISMGIYMRFAGGITGRPYCVQIDTPPAISSSEGAGQTADPATGRRLRKGCQADYGSILINFGRIFLVLTVALQWPAYLYFIRRWKRRKLAPTEFALEVKKRLAPWNSAMAEIFPSSFFSRVFFNRSMDPQPLPGGGCKGARIIGRILGIYMVGAGFCVFGFLSFLAWVEFDMNHGADFCSYDAPENVHDFFVGYSRCKIRYFTILFRLGPSLVFLTMLLQIPAYIYYAGYFWFHYRRNRPPASKAVT